MVWSFSSPVITIKLRLYCMYTALIPSKSLDSSTNETGSNKDFCNEIFSSENKFLTGSPIVVPDPTELKLTIVLAAEPKTA